MQSIYCDDALILDSPVDRCMILYSLAGDLVASRIDYLNAQDDSDDLAGPLDPVKDFTVINNVLQIKGAKKGDTIAYFNEIKDSVNNKLLKIREEDSLLLADDSQLNSDEWDELTSLNEKLKSEYSLRREMLLLRVDTTISSFNWKSDQARVDSNTLRNIYEQSRKKLTKKPKVTLAHSLAARTSDCQHLLNDVISGNHVNCVISVPTIEGTANQGAQQRLQLHKYIIGDVPDRGGRPGEQPTPPKESFRNQRQREQFKNRRGRGGGGNDHDNRRQRDTDQTNRFDPTVDHTPNHHQRVIPEQTNRVQNAGWNNDYYRQSGSFVGEDRNSSGRQYGKRGRGGGRGGNRY